MDSPNITARRYGVLTATVRGRVIKLAGSGGDTDPTWYYSGNLTGFVILFDHDQDGTHESVGHMWVARAWRRRGIARRLLAEARTRFDYQRVEGPLTEESTAFFAACPELRGSR